MDINDILNLKLEDASRMDYQELYNIAKTAFSIANRRIKELEKRGLSELSPAYRVLDVGNIGVKTGKFDLKGLDTRQQLLSEVKRVRSFLKAPTSTVKGVKKDLKRMSKFLMGNSNIDVMLSEFNSEELSQLWRIFNELKETENIAWLRALGSGDAMKAIVEYAKDNKFKFTTDDLRKEAVNWLKENRFRSMYEEKEANDFRQRGKL